MRFRERPDERGREQDGGPSQSDDTLNEFRDAGEGFLAAADDAIRRALSSDSEAFLRQNRQRGGQ